MHIEWPASVLKSLLLFNTAEGNKTFLSACELFEPPLSETPSTKPQAPEKSKSPNTKLKNRWRGKRGAGPFLSFELVLLCATVSSRSAALLLRDLNRKQDNT